MLEFATHATLRHFPLRQAQHKYSVSSTRISR